MQLYLKKKFGVNVERIKLKNTNLRKSVFLRGCNMLKHCKSRNNSVQLSFAELGPDSLATLGSDGMNESRGKINSEKTSLDFEVKSSNSIRPKSSLSWMTSSTMEANVAKSRTLETIAKEDNKGVGSHVSFPYRCILLASIIMTFILGITFAIGVIYIGYYPEQKFLNTGDTLVIDYSTYFCSAVSTTSSNIWLTTLVNVDKNKEVQYTMSDVLRIEVGQFWSRMFYFHRNSSLNIIWQSNEIIYLFIFEDKRQFDIWTGRKTSESYLVKSACCFNKNTVDASFEFVSEKDSDYYIAFYRPGSFGRAVSLNLTLKFRRSSFDFSKTKANCQTSKATGCSVPLSFGSDENTIIEVPNTTKRGIPKENEVEWKCEARVWFYFVVFGSVVIALCAVFVLIFFIHKHARMRLQGEQRKPTRPWKVLQNEATADGNRNNVASGFVKGPVPRDAVSYESIENYHNWALDEEEWVDITQETLKSVSSYTPSERESRSASQVATIYKDKADARMCRLSSNASIVKYVAKKPRKQAQAEIGKSENAGSSLAANQEIILNFPPFDPPGEQKENSQHKNEMAEKNKELFLHPSLKPSRSTGYFRVLSPIIQKKTGKVTGQKERRTPNPVFYRPGSRGSVSNEKISIGNPINI